MSSEKTPTAAPDKAEQTEVSTAPETPLSKLTARLADITKQANHTEMWGVELSSDTSHAPTQVVLQKFLRANNSDLAAAEKQLVAALEWRKRVQPASLIAQAFDKQKFDGLGFVTTHKNEAGKETVITWNIYGSVKNNKATFGDVTEFIKWRAALMELGVQRLRLNDITEPIPEDGTDEYQMLQVHDYQSVSFFRMDPNVKAASKETISVFSTAYPELLAHKYFVNVPAIMGWMFGAMKLFLAPTTLKKFHPMTSGITLSTELKDISSSLPKEYGGKGPSVQEGTTVTLIDATEAAKEEAPAESKREDAPVEPKQEAPVESKTEEPAVETKKEDTPVEIETKEVPVESKKEEADTKPSEETIPAEDTKPAAETAETTKTEAAPEVDAPPKETEAVKEAEPAAKEPKTTAETSKATDVATETAQPEKAS